MNYLEYLAATRAGPIPSEMAFPREEFQARVAALRKAMAARGLDALALCDPGNMYYVAGYYTFETSVHGCVVLPLEGEPFIQVLAIEASNPLIKGWLTDIVAYTRAEPEMMSRQLIERFSALGIEAGRIGLDASLPGLRLQVFREIQAALPEARFEDATDILMIQRRVKSAREIAYHREAARFTVLGMKAARAELRAGATENDVAAAAYSAMVRAGSEFMSIQPIVASGHRHAYNHLHFFRRKLQAGDSVMLEFGGTYHRYTSPMIRTGHIGAPTAEFLKISDAAREAADRILAFAAPGKTCDEVTREALKAYAKVEDVAYHYGGYGYGVGAQFPPSWVEPSAFFVVNNKTVLEPGMLFHLPICYRVPRRFAAGYSETVLITEKGCEALTDNDRSLYVATAGPRTKSARLRAKASGAKASRTKVGPRRKAVRTRSRSAPARAAKRSRARGRGRSAPRTR
jgi:Xaa-Pro aminopeptidase